MSWIRLVTAALWLAGSLSAQQSYDLVVYGGTAGGVMTAVSGARQGLKVALVSPGNHIGGMVSGGFSATDVGRREVIGGLSLEFYRRAGRHYGLDRHLQDLAWLPEPKAAESILRAMLQESGVAVAENHRLREKTGVRKDGVRIVEITTENVARFQGKVFTDASDEGDLMAQAGVKYTSLTPKRAESANLLVPVCFSASHVAYSSMRMEPQHMIIGHASGVAAALAIKKGVAVQDIPVADLQKTLLAEGAVFEYGIEQHNRALAIIGQRDRLPARAGPSPWARPATK